MAPPQLELTAQWATVAEKLKQVAAGFDSGSQWGKKSGTRQPTRHPWVWIREVPSNTVSGEEVEISSVETIHKPIDDWGNTVSNAILEYALVLAKNGEYVVLPKSTKMEFQITLRPKSKFNEIRDFAPFYREFRDDYHGDRTLFCRTKGMRLDPAYNVFGTVEGVKHHEMIHASLAAVLAKRLFRETVAELSGSFETREAATAAFLDIVDEVWKQYQGQIHHSGQDEVYVWERECAHYIDLYEAAGKPGL